MLDGVLDARIVGEGLGWTDGCLLCVLVGMLVGDSFSESKIELMSKILVATPVGFTVGLPD